MFLKHSLKEKKNPNDPDCQSKLSASLGFFFWANPLRTFE